MDHTVVQAGVVRDEHGVECSIPVILTDQGPLIPLVDYMLISLHSRSHAWRSKLAQAVSLLIQYLSANEECFATPHEAFSAFVGRLVNGTVDEDGYDRSGLYWDTKNPRLANQLVQYLNDFTDWMAGRYGAVQINAWRQATEVEQIRAWAKWSRKKDRAFLAHAMSRKKAATTIKMARAVSMAVTPVFDREPVKNFPEDRIGDLLWKGFIVPGKQNSPRPEERINLRDILIVLLMRYGGLRISETLHLYVQDVVPDPFQPQKAYVRLYHPSLGKAPADWLDSKGRPMECNRSAYLRGKYGLLPRNAKKGGAYYIGWKNLALDSQRMFADVHWFPSVAGEVFQKLWIFYMMQRSRLACGHPFAFVTETGTPYGYDAFKAQFKTAVERIGLDHAKHFGTTPHGLRHAYGRDLTNAGVDPLIRKKALHHKSITSQLVYTELDRQKISQLLASASVEMSEGASIRAVGVFDMGFEDVDPLGLLSGPNPRLRRG
ncbi:MAG: site-specific integrase [Propionivibrio sp.]|jgi:integrase|nr:site-specific integrase [Propionivibrio sp.]MBP8275715.1 site-specific integrase [Propionivibrio sp.]